MDAVAQRDIEQLAYEHGIRNVNFENLVDLGRKAVIVYRLQDKSETLSFDELCSYIKMFISTPFGVKALKYSR